MKIFIDTTPLKTGHAVRGVGSYTRNLVEALRERKDVELVNKDPEIVHIPYFDLFFDTLRVDTNVATVVTIYDVIPLIYPKHYPPGIKGRLGFASQKRKLKDVAAIITISETSKKDIVRLLEVPQGKIYPIHLAPGPKIYQLKDTTLLHKQSLSSIRSVEKYNLPEKFVLYVGDVNYNKNILNLVKACKLIYVPLVIVGKQAADEGFDKSHIENQSLVHLIEEYGDDKDVLRVGYVPYEDLVKIYNLAAVYCQPSFYEGFGLPVLEAMASGTPVVVARTQALVEVAEGAALFADPKDANDIANKIMQIYANEKLRNLLRKKGLEHVKIFSWEKVADETIKVYKEVAG